MNLCFGFLLLAIDCAIGVAFPYRYRKIMTTRVACNLIAVAWLMAAIMMFIISLSYTVCSAI